MRRDKTAERFYKRQFRRGCFDIFASDAEPQFTQIAQRDPDHQSLQNIYGFHVVHGGREGGLEKQVVEVFYGNWPYDLTAEISNRDPIPSRVRKRLLVEQGASLVYERVDNGSVLVTLIPAKSERFARHEEMVLLCIIRQTEKLTGIGTLKKHWRFFHSYMEYTSLDGLPTTVDYLRVWWVLFTRRLVVDGKERTPLFIQWGLKIIGYSLTVGLAGFWFEILKQIH